MNPMDNAQMTSQMAQISTVTGVQQVNQAIQELSGQLASMQMLQAARWSAAACWSTAASSRSRTARPPAPSTWWLPADSVEGRHPVGRRQGHRHHRPRRPGSRPPDLRLGRQGRMTSGTVSYRVTASQGSAVATQHAGQRAGRGRELRQRQR
jgi:hypothetical protein